MKPISGFVLVFGLIGFLYSCQSARSSANSNYTGKSYPLRVSFQADYVFVQQTESVALWNLDISSQPKRGRISTSGDGYFLTLLDNTVNANLPYYGQRYEFLGANDESDILFKDKFIENITYSRTADHNIVSLEFDVRQITERFHVQLVIQRNKKAYLLLSSPQRQSIQYEGRVKILSEPQKSLTQI